MKIVDTGIDPAGSVVMWWRHEKPNQLLKAFEKGYKVVLCPRIPLYFDFVQAEKHQWGRKWSKGYAPLDLVYRFPARYLARSGKIPATDTGYSGQSLDRKRFSRPLVSTF